LPPDRRGRIHERDCAALLEFRALRDRLFAHDQAHTARASASNIRDNSAAYAPQNAIDGDWLTYWTTNDHVANPELVLDFDRPFQPGVVSLREYLPLGQRVDSFALDAWLAGGWREVYAGEAIGHRRLVQLPDLTTARLRLRVTRSAACPAIREFSVFANH
jgi:alpha-L-fucosidase